jgi:hypothetical protein
MRETTKTSAKKALSAKVRSRNAHLPPEHLIGENDRVRDLAELFNEPSLHVRRAFFRHVCNWTGVPEAMVEDVHLYLLAEGTKEARAETASGAK